jgi:D-glycero-D-manno-heptose 1,7-bisphosphate phosphatase
MASLSLSFPIYVENTTYGVSVSVNFIEAFKKGRMNIQYIVGDATHPLGDGNKVIAHICNDIGAWGAGFVLAIATNQPGPAKGQYSEAAVKRTNDALVAKLAAEGIAIAQGEVCMHHPSIGPCACRKPAPGMLDAIATALHADRAASWMIGDARADLDAGRAAKMRTALVFRTDRCELFPWRGGPAAVGGAPDVCGKTLSEVAALLIAADVR